MRRFLVVLIIILISLPAYSKHEYTEKTYQKYWCNKKGGITEYKLNNKTRVDCLTDNLAVEFDFAPKWHECIG